MHDAEDGGIVGADINDVGTADTDVAILLFLLLFPVLSPRGATTTTPALLSPAEPEPSAFMLAALLVLLLLMVLACVLFLFFPPVEHGQACPHMTQHLIPSGTFGHGLFDMCPGKFTKLLNSGICASLNLSISPWNLDGMGGLMGTHLRLECDTLDIAMAMSRWCGMRPWWWPWPWWWPLGP